MGLLYTVASLPLLFTPMDQIHKENYVVSKGFLVTSKGDPLCIIYKGEVTGCPIKLSDGRLLSSSL